MKKGRLPLGVALMVSCFAIAHGCICGEKPSVALATEESEAVFAGKVVGRMKFGVRFKIEESFKGGSRRYIYIHTGNLRNDCDPWFRVGEAWLIYAVRVPVYRTGSATKPYTKRLVARRCGRNARSEDALEDLQELRKTGSSKQIRTHGQAPPPNPNCLQIAIVDAKGKPTSPELANHLLRILRILMNDRPDL